MRWSLDLPVQPHVAAPLPAVPLTPETLAQQPGALDLGPDEAGHTAKVWVFRDGDALAVATLGRADANRKKPAYPEFYLRDHLVVMVNPGHDHATRRMYSVDDSGTVRGEAALVMPGETPKDAPHTKLPDPPAAVGEFRTLPAGGFFARLFIPGADLWAGGVTGLCIKVGFHDELVCDAVCWPVFPQWSRDLPFAYGDLYNAPPAWQLERLEIPKPAWGGDPSAITLRGKPGAGSAQAGRLRAEVVTPPEFESTTSNAVEWSAQGGVAQATVPVLFPHRAKWTNPLKQYGRVRLFVDDAQGRTLWQAEYPFGFDLGIIVRERYGRQGKPLPPRPAPNDPQFVDRFRAYVLARLPDYRARTTASGAPSDFYREDAEGGDHLDLSKPGSLDRVAEMLARRFPDWQDALCAAAMWVYHPTITRHSGSWTGVSGQVTPEALMRLGGCFCSDTTFLAALLAEKIGARLGVSIKGYSMGLRGHLCTALDTPVGRVVIDGMHGLFYHALDNTRLATLEEMRTQRGVTKRMWYFTASSSEEFYFGNYHTTIRPVYPRPMVWPMET